MSTFVAVALLAAGLALGSILGAAMVAIALALGVTALVALYLGFLAGSYLLGGG